nr:hypothetical protein [Sphingomonas laterariae]
MIAAAQPAFATETPPAPSATDNKRDPNAIRCKSEPIIGSLAGKRKVCRTNAEWQRAAEDGKRNASDIVGGSGSCAGGPGCAGGN